jgi:DNA-binding CsgD family transcriptional regulator
VRFDEINNDFLKKIKGLYPQLTSTDLKLCAYLQLNMSSKEIAQLMNISLRGVEISRYRLRKKLQLPTEKSFVEFFAELT